MKKILHLAAIAILFSVGGCSKSDDKSGGSLRVIHASPDVAAIDIFIDGGLSSGNVLYGSNSGYVLMAAESFSLNIFPSGSSTAAANLSVTLPMNVTASLLTADSITKLKTSLVADNNTMPPTGKSGVRFFHLVAGGAPFNVSRSGTNIYTGRNFFDQVADGSLASYIAVDPGTQSYEIKLPGNSTPIATLSSVNLDAGKNYTIIAKGFTAGTGAQAISLGIFTDN